MVKGIKINGLNKKCLSKNFQTQYWYNTKKYIIFNLNLWNVIKVINNNYILNINSTRVIKVIKGFFTTI